MRRICLRLHLPWSVRDAQPHVALLCHVRPRYAALAARGDYRCHPCNALDECGFANSLWSMLIDNVSADIRDLWSSLPFARLSIIMILRNYNQSNLDIEEEQLHISWLHFHPSIDCFTWIGSAKTAQPGIRYHCLQMKWSVIESRTRWCVIVVSVLFDWHIARRVHLDQLRKGCLLAAFVLKKLNFLIPRWHSLVFVQYTRSLKKLLHVLFERLKAYQYSISRNALSPWYYQALASRIQSAIGYTHLEAGLAHAFAYCT